MPPELKEQHLANTAMWQGGVADAKYSGYAQVGTVYYIYPKYSLRFLGRIKRIFNLPMEKGPICEGQLQRNKESVRRGFAGFSKQPSGVKKANKLKLR